MVIVVCMFVGLLFERSSRASLGDSVIRSAFEHASDGDVLFDILVCLAGSRLN